MTSLDCVDLGTLLRLEADLSPQTIEGFLEFVRGSYGLAHIAFICPSLGWRRVRDPFLALAYSDAWLEHLQIQGWNKAPGQDDVSAADGAGLRAFLDWTFLPRVKCEIERMLRDAKEAGSGENGLIVPVMGSANNLAAIFVVTSDEQDADWSARRYDLTKAMVRIAHYVYQRAHQLHLPGVQADFDEISPIEVTVLKSLAEGNGLNEIMIAVCMSAERVKMHLKSARYKLQALNRAHAVAKAFRAGLIG